MEKQISAAVLFTDGQKFLAVHPTGEKRIEKYWDLPKGVVDSSETFTNAAIREFHEEVGIYLNRNKLRYLGQYPLHDTKDVIIYLYVIDTLPSLGSMKCSSMTTNVNKDKSPAPEIDNYRYFNLTDYTKIRKALHPVMRDVIIKIKEFVE